MKKIFFLIYIFLFLNFSYAENFEIKTREDIKIEEFQKQIKLLENKIEEQKKLKSQKSKDDLKIALVLSGGGAKGYAHLGVLKVLERENIKIDYITGTSIGAFVGTLYSIGYSIDEIEKILDKLNIENFLDSGLDMSNLSLDKKESLKKYSFYINFDNELNYSLPKGLRETEPMYLEIKNLVKNYEDIKSFNDLPIPVRIIATNLNTGYTKSFDSGDLAKILTASMSIPTILEPVEINGSIYVDGLVSRNLPVQDAYAMGADLVIASDVGTPVIKKENYNIFSVLNQMIAIQSSYITRESKEKASVLISPDVSKISATDSSKKMELIKLGELAAEKQIEQLKQFPKNSSKKNTEPVLKNEKEKFLITQIEYNKNFDKSTTDILNDIFKDLLNRPITEDDIEKKIVDTYNLKYVNKIYYSIKGNILHLDGEKGHLNRVGMGIDYRTGHGATFNLGTDLFFNGKFGNNVNLNFKFGDYWGANLGTLSYYGIKNKFGILTNVGYNENPFFQFEDKGKKAKFINREAFFNLGLFTQITNNTMLSYGVLSKISSLKLDTGDSSAKKIEYSGNSTKTYVRLKYDKLDSISNPMKGLKVDLIYNFSNSFGNSKSNLYGPSYSVKGYLPVSKKTSLLFGMNSAVLRGDNIRPDQFIKLGGMYSNIDNNEFEFYGFNYQEKQVKDFVNFTFGLKQKIFYSLYFTTRFNAATFTENSNLLNNNYDSRSRLWKDFSRGVGASLSYDSPIGPIEISVASDVKNRKPIGSISIGYKLD